MIFCTVSTHQHFSLAVNMALSIRTMHPEAKIVLCLVEEELTEITPYQDIFDDMILAKQLGFRSFYRHMFRHNEIEGPCSCKARLMLYALQKYPDSKNVVYIDSDMRVYGPLTELQAILDQHPIVLTPHNSVPKPSVVKYGYYNAGLVALRRSPVAWSFLRWWIQKLDRKCFQAVARGINADQKWLDEAPQLFGAYSLVHPGYNVGPWNIAERMITRAASGSWLVNGEPLKVFHFSRFLRQENIQSYLHIYAHLLHGAKPKVIQSVSQLIAEYHAELLTQSVKLSDKPWSYSHYVDGKPIHLQSRLVFRRQLHRRFRKVRNPFQKSDLFFGKPLRKKKRLRKRRRIR